MDKDETPTQRTVVEATPEPAKQRRAKIAAAVVGVCLLAIGSSVAASLALGWAMGDHGPPGSGSERVLLFSSLPRPDAARA